MRALPPDIGQRIRAEREKRGLSQRELAVLSGISLRHLIQIEAGENFTVAILLALRSALAEDPCGPFLSGQPERVPQSKSTERH